MGYKKTEGKCAFGIDRIEVEKGRCMDALNFTVWLGEDHYPQDDWDKRCKDCPLFHRGKFDTKDITEARLK